MAIEVSAAAAPVIGRRSHVDLSAIIAGALIGVGAAVVFTGFSTVLGLGSFSFDDSDKISIGWFIVTAIFTIVWVVAVYWIGGYVTGRMRARSADAVANEVSVRDGIHGLAVWGLGMLASGFLAAGLLSDVGSTAVGATETAVEAAGSIAQGAGQVAGGVASGIGQAVGGVDEGTTFESMLPEGLRSNPIDYISGALLRTTPQATQRGAGSTFPAGSNVAPATGDASSQGDSAAEVATILMNLLSTGEVSDDDRAYLQALVAARTELGEAEADARVDQAIERTLTIRTEAQDKLAQMKAEATAKVEEAKDKAARIAEQTRIAAVLTAFLLAAASLVAAAAAYIGAVRGGRHRDEGRIWGGLAWRHP